MDLSLVNSGMQKFGLCVLLLIHSIYSLFKFLSNETAHVLLRLKKLYSRTHVYKYVSVNSLKDELKCFPKIPKHLAIIIEEEDVSYYDCIKLILWCIHSGIPFITFYSYNSAINPTSLYEVLCKRSKSSLQNIKWGKSFHKSVQEMAKKDINGYVWTPMIEVNMFSVKSVYESFENVMLRLCQDRVDPDQITIDTVDQTFKDEIPLPDPCFALVFGETFSTFGFMPWQIRITEFKQIHTHHNLQVEDFFSALEIYAHCDQRFGK